MLRERVVYKVFHQEQYALLTINRPEASNAIDTQTMEELRQYLMEAEQDKKVHAVILTGAGTRAFIAGGDLKEFHQSLHSETAVYEKMSQMRAVLEYMIQYPKPIIAALNGAARGGGGEVAAACHFRIASDTCTVGFVQVKLGISPGWGGGVLLQRIVGRQRALQMLLTGESYDASALQQLGFVDTIVPPEKLLPTAILLAKQLSALSTHAVQGILTHLRKAESLPLFQAMEAESRLCSQLWMTEEHIEQMNAFQKRS